MYNYTYQYCMLHAVSHHEPAYIQYLRIHHSDCMSNAFQLQVCTTAQVSECTSNLCRDTFTQIGTGSILASYPGCRYEVRPINKDAWMYLEITLLPVGSKNFIEIYSKAHVHFSNKIGSGYLWQLTDGLCCTCSCSSHFHHILSSH